MNGGYDIPVGIVLGVCLGALIMALLLYSAIINPYKKELVEAGVYQYDSSGKFVKVKGGK